MFKPKTLVELCPTSADMLARAAEEWQRAPDPSTSKAQWLWLFVCRTARAKLKGEFLVSLLRTWDQVVFDCGGRDTSPMYEPEEWDAELEKALDAEFRDIVDQVPGIRDTFAGVGFGREAVDAETIANEMAAVYVERMFAESVPIDFSRAGMPSTFLADFIATTAAAVPLPPAHPTHPMQAPPPPLPGAPAGVAKLDEAAAFRRVFDALEWDPGVIAAALDVSVGTVRNYASGRSTPRKALTVAQARAMHEFALRRAQALQEAAAVFAVAAAEGE